MLCQKCGKEIPENSLFCPECGEKQELESAQVNQSAEKGGRDTFKYCANCGCQIPVDSRFCPECRAKQDDVLQSPKTQSKGFGAQKQQKKVVAGASLSSEEEEKNKKRNKIIAIVVGGAVALCIVIGILSSLIKPTINLNNYLTVSFEGYDTVGKAIVTFDVEKFESDYEKKLSVKNGKKPSEINTYRSEEAKIEALFEPYDSSSKSGTFLLNCVDGSLDRDSGLSNGDTVIYTWNCDDEYALETYGYKLKYEDIEYTVSDLKEAETFDPFNGIEVVFSGIAPDGVVSIEGKPSAEAAQDLSYDIDVTNGLSNGDTVTLTASMYNEDPVEYCIDNYGMIPSPLTKTYKVEGLNSYIQSASDISEEALKSMQNQAEDVYRASVAQSWGEDEILESFTYLGNYFLTNKSADDYWGYNNILYLVYKAQVKDEYSNDGESYNETNDIYWYISYYDLLVDSNGITTVDVTNYRTTSDRFAVDSGVSSDWWNTKTWYYYGYQTLSELYKVAVTSNSESYNHEDNVGEGTGEEAKTEAGIILPDSSEKMIEEKEIEELSDEDLRYAINELYARHGYIFKDDELRAYYQQFDWYKETVQPDEFSMDLFNDIEKQNIEKLQEERDRRN